MSNLPKVVVIDNQFIGIPYDHSIESETLTGVAEVDSFRCEKNEDIPSNIADVDAILAWHHLSYTKDVLQTFKKCKLIVRIGMGFDNVDTKAAGEIGIRVCNVPDYGVEEVADSTLALLLNLMRRTYWVANGTKSGNWNTIEAKGATRLAGRTLGLIGLGRIGTAVALRAKAFNLKVVYYDPYIEYGRAKALGVFQVESLEELLSQSDIVSVHCPLIHNGISNVHLLNKETMKHLKKDSYIINTARGPIIQEEALLEALQDGRVKGAGLDVFEKEPYMKGPLLDHPNVIVTPHSAFYSDQGHVEMVTKAALEAKRLLSGKEVLYCVNKQFLQ